MRRSGVSDFEWIHDSLYVSRKAGSVVHVDLDTGAPLDTIDLTSLRIGTGQVEVRRMLQADGRLYVQVARMASAFQPQRGAIAVIDLETTSLAQVIELEAQDASGTLVGLNPDFPMTFDAKRRMVVVTAAGDRPSDTGMLVRIDVDSLTIHDAERANAGFQGAVAFAEPFDRLFVIYHTSTPVTSSHLFANLVAADGTMQYGNSTLVDAFDGQDALAIDADGLFVAMANTCVAGFCIGGAGVSFVDTHTGTVLPKLMADQIGFEPTIVQFR